MFKEKYVRRFVTDILYADLEEGCVDFLKLAYDKLELHDKKRLMEMRKRHHKISGNIMNAVFEDIIGIIVEEICEKENKILHEELMDYYSDRFPLIKEEIEKYKNNIDKWLDLYKDSFNGEDGDLINFQRRSFILLCCCTYGEKNAVNNFFGRRRSNFVNHYERKSKYDFYGKQNNGGYMEWIDKIWNHKNFLNDYLYKIYIEHVRQLFADYLGTDSDKIEKEILNMLQSTRPNLYKYNDDKILDEEVECLKMHDGLNGICWEHHVNQLKLSDNNLMYLDIIKRLFEKWCFKEAFNVYIETGGTYAFINILEKKFNNEGLERCLSELITMFWLECYVMNQEKIWDEYYKRFSFDNQEEDIKNLLEENTGLKEENNRYKKKIEEYADADAERKKQQNKEAKKNDRMYAEQISSVERQLEEQKKENEKLCQMLGDRDRYIGLLETGNDAETSGKEVDYSKFYNIRIAFIGAKTETVSRLKAVFGNAAFINNETTEPLHKIDLIVILAGSENHALAYKYIGLAGKQNINVIYSASTNIESIVQKVADSI